MLNDRKSSELDLRARINHYNEGNARCDDDGNTQAR